MLFAYALPELRTTRELVLPSLVAIVFLASLSACRIEITVPKGGSVETESGAISCDTDQSCNVDVVDVFFDETFTAIPDAEYTFLHWKKKQRGFCGGSDEPCRLFTSGFDGNAALLQFLESDEVFYLEPVFLKPDSWTRKPSMTQGRLGLGACTVGDKLYAVGGYDWSRNASALGPGLVINEMYDSESNTWQTLASMNVGRRWLSVAGTNQRCFAIGGQQTNGGPGERSIEEYNPQTDTWARRADMPGGRLGHASVALGDFIYVLGGTSSPDSSPVATLFAYNIKNDSWTRKSDLPRARVFLSAAAADGSIFAFGGSGAFGSSPSADVMRYDPINDSWNILEDMPESRAEHGTSVIEGQIYVIGGRGGELCPQDPSCSGTPPLSSVYEFDPEAGTWTARANMLGGRSGLASGSIDGRIYAAGGTRLGYYARSGNPALEEYTPTIGD